MENCPGTSLDKYFLSETTQLGKQNKDRKVLGQIYKYILQIAKALEHISNPDKNNNIFHRDISLKRYVTGGTQEPTRSSRKGKRC